MLCEESNGTEFSWNEISEFAYTLQGCSNILEKGNNSTNYSFPFNHSYSGPVSLMKVDCVILVYLETL